MRNWSTFSPPRQGGTCAVPAPFPPPTPTPPPCPPPNACLVALINQLIAAAGGGGVTSPPQVLQGIGPPQSQAPAIAKPSVSTALYTDVTIPNDYAFWQWNGTVWTELIAA